jgi:hypothetical protein
MIHLKVYYFRINLILFINIIEDDLRSIDEIWYNANQNEAFFEKQWTAYKQLKRQGLGKHINKFTFCLIILLS